MKFKLYKRLGILSPSRSQQLPKQYQLLTRTIMHNIMYENTVKCHFCTFLPLRKLIFSRGEQFKHENGIFNVQQNLICHKTLFICRLGVGGGGEISSQFEFETVNRLLNGFFKTKLKRKLQIFHNIFSNLERYICTNKGVCNIFITLFRRCQ